MRRSLSQTAERRTQLGRRLVQSSYTSVSGLQIFLLLQSKMLLQRRDRYIAPLRESASQMRSGMARVLKGFHSFACTPTRSNAIGMSW